MAGTDDKGTGADKPRPQTAKKATAAKKAAPKAKEPTPENIGIEGTPRVIMAGGHIIDGPGQPWEIAEPTPPHDVEEEKD